MHPEYQICKTCVMDTSDLGIEFVGDHCNHCLSYHEKVAAQLVPAKLRDEALARLLGDIKTNSASKKYDCIIGVSGGVDSSYVAYLAKQWGLRALLVHLDNGWNSDISVKNISNIAKTTGFDLYTYVIDWDDFRDIQLSLFRASVVDIELATDHAIKAVLYKIAAKFRCNFVFSGGNVITEAIMPVSWRHTKVDWKNLKDIHKKYGSMGLQSYPRAGIFRQQFYKHFYNITFVPVLAYVDFERSDVIEKLKGQLLWSEYGGKHHESIFTRFYQGYILPNKFGIDKRRAHLSNLICAKQIERAAALEQLEKNPYDEQLMAQDRAFVIKKLGWSEEEFDAYIARPGRSHYEFKSDEPLVEELLKLRAKVRGCIRSKFL